jgi:antirestriction protein ArdC
MGAAFLSAHCHIDGQLQHASYVDSWLRVLRTDKRAVFISATKAQQAGDFILARTQPPPLAEAA